MAETLVRLEDLERVQETIIGIDLGTTNSLVALVQNGEASVLTSREGRRLIPSVVTFDEGRPIVGYAAKYRKVRDAGQTVFSVKRLLGRSFEDLKEIAATLPYEIVPPGDRSDGVVRIRGGENQVYSVVEISAMILRELKSSAEEALGKPVTKAVVTVPAYFNDSQRQATRTAARLAGLDVLRILNEPTAAALAYGLYRKQQGLIAVYDLGGGTFDISILKLHDGIFEVLSTNGNTALGGDDMDQAIAAVAGLELKRELGIDAFADAQTKAAILEAAEGLKIALAEKEEAAFEVKLQGKTYRRIWTRSEFETVVRPVLERTRIPCLNALKDAGVEAQDLSDVVMVGGPTRLKLVQQVAREIFGKEPNTSMHPDEVVAQGAAIQADILAGNNKDFLLLDVVPLSLGIETYGGVMSPIIHRNTRIPAVAREIFTTFVDNQTGVDIHVLQGEREKVADNRSLAKFKLAKISPMPAGRARIQVTFLIDADGILQVAARDLQTGNEQSVEVRPSYGLSDAEVEKMLVASAENVEQDIEYRKLVEARNYAAPILKGAERTLPDARRLLPTEEVKKIEDRIQALTEAMKKDDSVVIQRSCRQLNQVTIRLAELLMSEAVVGGAGKGASDA